MVEKKDNPTNAELLKISADIVMSEYVTRKNDIHEKWIVESLYLWQSQGVRLAYPQLPPYPSNEDIIAKARSLADFLKTPRPDLGDESMAVNNNITINNTHNEQAPEKEKKESLFTKVLKILTFFKKPS